MLGDRTVVQADKAELPLEILLWRKRKCHQDTDLGDAYSQSASDGNEKETDAFLEFLRTCHHDTDYAYVLSRFLQPV